MKITEKELKQEKIYLGITIDVIREKISELGQELYEREDKVKEFQKFIWDSKADMDSTEMKSIISQNDTEIALMQNKAKYLTKLYRVQDSPYFGAMIFKQNDVQNKIYLGITHVEDEENDVYLVNDWRSPICTMYYDYEQGPAEYTSPGGVVKGEILQKRQFNIKNGEIVRVFDNNLNIDDELLQEVLSDSQGDTMKNIVNTIQKEQNNIIRDIEHKHLIVQGIAGSGKTSVALHRIAFLLYKIKNLSSNNILIFSPNQIFSEYISNVLPELGEENAIQTTFNDFLASYVDYNEVEPFTSFIERHYKKNNSNDKLIYYKQSDKAIEDIDNYVDEILDEVSFAEDYQDRDIVISKDELNNLLKDRYSKMLLNERIELIIEKVIDNYYDGSKSRVNTIKKTINGLLNIKIDFKNLYSSFYLSKSFANSYGSKLDTNEIKRIENSKTISYEDACLYAYLKSKLVGFDYRGEIKQVVIDEAQDYSLIQYIILKNIFKKANFTILGDINQTINPYYKYESLKVLEDLFDESKYLELTKTYRSSPEIIDYTNKILDLNYVSAIRRSNNIPVVIKKENNIKEQLIEDINNLRKEKYKVAIITKTDDEANYIYEKIKDDIDVSLLNYNSVRFSKDIVVIPVYVAKGLEFESVIVYTKEDNKYTNEEKYLNYVACTRAQHELIIYNQ